MVLYTRSLPARPWIRGGVLLSLIVGLPTWVDAGALALGVTDTTPRGLIQLSPNPISPNLIRSNPISQNPLSQKQSRPKDTIRIGGSSTMVPILREAIRAFRAAGHGAAIDLQETGTTEGFRRFCAGRLDIANASRPINAQELQACASQRIRFIELPMAFDALTIIVHPSNTWARQISTKELARLWARQSEGKVDRWSQVNRAWPDRAIKLCGPGKDSGTYDYFNKAINGDAANSRQDYAASEDDNVIAKCVAQNPNALGYFGFSYFLSNRQKLRALAIATPGGAVPPSLANVQAGRYQPLARPLFLYINDSALASREEVRKFSTRTVRYGLDLVARAGDIPLPASTYRLVESKLYKRIPGSAFAGELPVGLTIGEALRRSFDANKLPQYR